MILRRALTGGVFGLLLAAGTPVAAASAAPGDYPPGGGVTISLSASVVQVGGSVTVTGAGFLPGSTVDVSSTLTARGFAPLSGGIGPLSAGRPVERLAAVAVTAGADGSFSTSLSFAEIGTHVVTASGTSAAGAAASASATLEVVAAGGIGGGGGNGGSGGGSGAGSGAGSGGAGGIGGLPDTGASLLLPVSIGAVLVLAGAGLVAATRRRRRSASTV